MKKENYSKYIKINNINLKNDRAITLIALVITIIILIILAGISINMTIGENGILTKSKQAKENFLLATNAEQESLRSAELALKDSTTGEDETLKPYILSETIGGANSPDISNFNCETTKYVTWDRSSTPYQPQEEITINNAPPSGWSNYIEKEWANIKTTGGGNDCYWVWIPRYAYKVPTKPTIDKATAETIEVKFLEGKTNTPIDGTTISLFQVTEEKSAPTKGDWVIHPAFTNEGNGGFGELTGIWVAKYEASSDSSTVVENPTETDLEIDGGSDTDTDLKVRVKPNVTSWRGITVNNIFNVCQNLTEPNNSICKVNNKKNEKLDAHMMKNTEWGAVAYLSMSIYGKNGEVWNNPYYNNTKNHSPITGLCGNSSNSTTVNINETCKYNEETGGNASTTGNVYGVYDMAGGAWEYTAGYLSKITANENYTTLASADSKYKDLYAGTSSDKNVNYNANAGKYGDAVYETSNSDANLTGSWNSSNSYFLRSGYPLLGRGGRASIGSQADVFAFYMNTGEASTDFSFRPVVLSSKL